MTFTIRLREEADRDLGVAASWYEQQSPGLGHKFLGAVLSAFQLIALQPLVYPIVHRNTRRALVSGFPFGIYFRVEQANIIVLAVLHGSRHPGRWQHRT